ncbi:MAG: hypothetical protein JXA46_05735 [Dehalococcoidales bacterium]|nr:hypothetical protein [Dehalococcoidales bacterium]
MNNNKNWFSRHMTIIYALGILAFIGLVNIFYYFVGVTACAVVSFGLPAFALAYGFGWENGRMDLLRKQEQQGKEEHIK